MGLRVQGLGFRRQGLTLSSAMASFRVEKLQEMTSSLEAQQMNQGLWRNVLQVLLWVMLVIQVVRDGNSTYRLQDAAAV